MNSLVALAAHALASARLGRRDDARVSIERALGRARNEQDLRWLSDLRRAVDASSPGRSVPRLD